MDIYIYIAFFLTKTSISHKKFQFFSVRACNNTTSPNFWGTDAWAVPHLKFVWGDRPSSPPRSPPMLKGLIFLSSSYHDILILRGRGGGRGGGGGGGAGGGAG